MDRGKREWKLPERARQSHVRLICTAGHWLRKTVGAVNRPQLEKMSGRQEPSLAGYDSQSACTGAHRVLAQACGEPLAN